MSVGQERVPLKYVRTLLKVAEAQGYDGEELLASTGLPPAEFAQAGDTLLPAHYYTKVYRRVMWLLQDESFGMNLRQKSPTGTFRMMCLCIIHCVNLEQAMRRAAEFNSFCRALTGQPHRASNQVARELDGTALFLMPDTQEYIADGGDNLYTVAHSIAIWRRFCGWLIGKPIEVLEVRFQAPQPAETGYLRQIFDCQLSFSQQDNAMRFADSYLSAPLIRSEDSLREFLRNAPYHLLAAQDDDDSSLMSQMRRLVGSDLSKEFPSVVDMADALNMSVRTLRRRLNEHGTTYQQFKDRLRQEAAERLLNRPELKINAVAALLGFDEPSAFHRSFKKWTGMTPGEYRQSRGSDGAH